VITLKPFSLNFLGSWYVTQNQTAETIPGKVNAISTQIGHSMIGSQFSGATMGFNHPYAILIMSCLLLPGAFYEQSSAEKPARPLYEDPAGYKILSLVLEDATGKSPEKVVRIFQFTSMNMGSYLDRISAKPEFKPAVRDLQKRSGDSQSLQAKFNLSHRYKIVSYSEPPVPAQYIPLADGTVPPSSDSELENKESYGVFSVSNVGFDETKTHAVVYVDFICGTVCGGSNIYFLERTGTRWRIKEMKEGWVH
jgi:hypothetical protein